MNRRSNGPARVGGLIVASVMIAGCAAGAPPMSEPATPGPTVAVAPSAGATVAARTEPPVTPTPEIVAIDASFAPDVEAPARAIELVMSEIPSPNFAPKELTAPAGTVTLFVSNPDARVDAQHDLKIGKVLRHASAGTPHILPGHSGVLTLRDIEAGEYIFWCSVQNHYLRGMQGVLTITP